MSLSDGLIDAELATTFLDTGPELVRWLEGHTPVQFRIIEDFPDYHPEHPGAKPHGGRSLECSALPVRRAGRLGGRVTVGPQMSGEHPAQRDRARPRRPGRRAESRTRAAHDRTTSGGPDRASSVRCCGPASTGGSSPEPGLRAASLVTDERRRVVGCRFRDRVGTGTGERRRGRAGHRRVRVGPRARAHLPARPDDAHGRPCRPTPATACGWRCASAPRLATCGRRGGCRHRRPDGGRQHRRPGRSTASAPARTASWSTAGASGSPTRRPTTTLSATHSTSIDVNDATSSPTIRPG